LNFIAQTYQGEGMAKEKICHSIENAIIFGIYEEDGQRAV
jgi:hypothetical protein|tara:strand:- start:8366 stop:8485 length:120 start_codon:yes stop_codon:yes gene_type:complete